MTINAPLDTVKHYDIAVSVNIEQIANASYHEYGTVPFVEIAKGRIALDNNSEVTKIHLNAKSQSEGFKEIIVSKDSSVEMPAFSRDAIDIATNGTLVVALGTEDITSSTELDYVWLQMAGIYEQITVSENISFSVFDATGRLLSAAILGE